MMMTTMVILILMTKIISVFINLKKLFFIKIFGNFFNKDDLMDENDFDEQEEDDDQGEDLTMLLERSGYDENQEIQNWRN